MKQSSISCRIPRAAFELFAEESIRQVRPMTAIITAGARALAALAPDQREAFTIGEPVTQADRARLGLTPGDFDARGVRRNRKGVGK
jgi:uracil-DNA glycosylase